MLKGVQDQLAALQKALPDSIQQELKAFHASTDPHQQQHSPQQPPQQLVQQQPQQGSLTVSVTLLLGLAAVTRELWQCDRSAS